MTKQFIEEQGVFVSRDDTTRGKLISLLGAMALDVAKPWVDELIKETILATEEELRKERKELLLSVNISELVKMMKDEIQEHGDMHGEHCFANSEDPDECNCEEMAFWGSQIEHYMAKVNDWWATHAEEHRKLCTPDGNKAITRMLGKKNRKTEEELRKKRYCCKNQTVDLQISVTTVYQP